MKLEVGAVLSGTLRLQRRIAEGGMGTVWMAEHLVLGTDVAVKLMSKQWAAMPNARTRFLREARMTARVKSPYVVRVLDTRFTEGDEPYIVLELLRGENLEQRVRRRGPLSPRETMDVVEQTCQALAACHDAGVVHRDVKPENVFLNRGTGAMVKLLDFGVAKPTRKEACIDVDHLPAGTPQYMSPEHIFEPAKTDERADLFSLAAVTYYALTGKPPFAADSLEGLYLAMESGRFARPTTQRADLPSAVDAWFEKALAHDAAHRFANAHEMANSLRAALGLRRPFGREHDLSRTTLRRPSATALAAVGFVAIVTSFVLTRAFTAKSAVASVSSPTIELAQLPAQLPPQLRGHSQEELGDPLEESDADGGVSVIPRGVR